MAYLCYRDDYINKFDGKTYLDTYFRLPYDVSKLDESVYMSALVKFLQSEFWKPGLYLY